MPKNAHKALAEAFDQANETSKIAIRIAKELLTITGSRAQTEYVLSAIPNLSDDELTVSFQHWLPEESPKHLIQAVRLLEARSRYFIERALSEIKTDESLPN